MIWSLQKTPAKVQLALSTALPPSSEVEAEKIRSLASVKLESLPLYEKKPYEAPSAPVKPTTFKSSSSSDTASTKTAAPKTVGKPPTKSQSSAKTAKSDTKPWSSDGRNSVAQMLKKAKQKATSVKKTTEPMKVNEESVEPSDGGSSDSDDDEEREKVLAQQQQDLDNIEWDEEDHGKTQVVKDSMSIVENEMREKEVTEDMAIDEDAAPSGSASRPASSSGKRRRKITKQVPYTFTENGYLSKL